MLRIFWCLAFAFLATPLFSLDEEPPLSTPTQLASISQNSRLIGGVVSPISGQVHLSKTDLVAQGAEPVALTRYYIPPFMLASFHEKPKKDKYFLHNQLEHNYRGWVYLQHCYLFSTTTKEGNKIRLCEPNGAVLEFLIDSQGRSRMLSSSYGINNLGEKLPGSQYDIRNTYLTKNGHEILVHTPDGTVRHYAPKVYSFLSHLNLDLDLDLSSYTFLSALAYIHPNSNSLEFGEKRD